MRLKSLLFPTLAALSLTAPAIAQGPAPEGRGRMAACRTDVATFCQNAEAGRGRRIACLLENKAKLSPDCAAAVEARLAEREARRGAPPPGGAALPQPPPAAVPGGQPVEPPAAAPAPAAPAPGKGALEGRGDGRGRGRLAACRADRAQLCADVERGRGRIVQCLKVNLDKLSPACSEAIRLAGAGRRMRAKGEGERALR